MKTSQQYQLTFPIAQELKLRDDSQIEPGAKWLQAIEMALQQAQVALLLVSDAFLASEFVMNEEVPRLLAAAEAKGVPPSCGRRRASGGWSGGSCSWRARQRSWGRG